MPKWLKLYKYFPPNLTYLAIAKPRCSQLLHNVEMYYLQQIIWNMVYLAALLVVVTDWLKTVRIRVRNVPRIHGHKRFDDDVFLASLPLQESDGVTCWCAWLPCCWNIKNRLRTTCACLAVASEQQSCLDSMPSSLWHQIWAIWANPVLGKNLQHPPLTK